MKREDLLKLGLTEEALEKAELDKSVIDKIMDLHGKDVEKNKNGLTDAQTTIESLQKQVEEANAQIEKFKSLKPEELQKAADDWKVKYEQAEQDYKNQVSSMKFQHALSDALTGAKVKNPKAVAGLLDMEGLKLDEKDGSILGLDKQLAALQESDSYLFASDEETPKIVTGVKSKSVVGDAFMQSALEAQDKLLGVPTKQ